MITLRYRWWSARCVPASGYGHDDYKYEIFYTCDDARLAFNK
jgi:hypothetical protein